MRKQTTLIAALLAGAFLAGCGGGGAELQAHSTTMGQELQDLQASYDKGIINEKEYKRAKKDILDRYD